MSVDSGDLNDWGVLPASTLYPLLGASLIGLYFFTIKQLFNSYNIFYIFEDYKAKKLQQERYSRLFETRENLMYHIGWARQRGESSPVELQRMIGELQGVDAAIDEMEERVYKKKAGPK